MPDYFQILNQQLAGKIQAAAGTPETLTSAEVKLKPFQSNFGFVPEYQRFTNDEVADDIGVAADFVSGKAGRITFGAAFKTSGVLGTVPAVGIYLRACGMKEQTVKTITIGAPTGGDGIFEAGAAYSATGGKSGVVEKTITGAGVLRYIVTAGGDIVATDTVTVGADSATASGTGATYGVKYSPRSTGQEILTLQRGIKNFNGTASQDLLQRIHAAMGTFTIDFAALDAIRFAADFRGPVDAIEAGAMFTGITYETATNANLPKLANSTIQINGVEVRPAAIQLDAGNTVELDPDPSTGGGTAGYDQARISRREPKLTIDPYRHLPSVLDDLGVLGDGSEIPISIICGTSPNMVEIAALKAQIREDTEADRAGLQVAQLTLHIIRNSVTDEDYAIYFR